VESRPTDLAAVLAAIARTAARLCEATDALIHLVEGDHHRLVAKHGNLAHFQRLGDTHAIRRDTPLGRAVVDRRPVHVRDVQVAARTRFRGLVQLHLLNPRIRTVLVMPLLGNGRALGGIVIRRARVQPFTTKQVALLRAFADHAAVAIENARLSQKLEARNRELTEALEQQTATSEILRVISRSPGDLGPVFETILANGIRLCEAERGILMTYDGDTFRTVAHRGLSPEALAYFLRPGRPGPLTGLGRMEREQQPVHISDILDDPAYTAGDPERLTTARLLLARTVLWAPIIRGTTLAGALVIYRQEVRPFGSGQIALLQTFADQAVIAIENARLFTELQARNQALAQALEQQTATSAILRAISGSPTDVQPVLDEIAEHAARLCEASFASVHRFDGTLLHVSAHHNYPSATLERSRQFFPAPPTRLSFPGRAILKRSVVHVPDTTRDQESDQDFLREASFRSVLSVPMLRDGQPSGTITVWRAATGSFSDRQISLLQTFAEQAVIAIENVRLFTELQARNAQLTESLAQQTAVGEILRAISNSPTDTQPVFDAIARSAVILCAGVLGAVFRFDGDLLHVGALHGYSPEGAEATRRAFPRPPTRGVIAARAVLERAIVHVPDVEHDAEFDQRGLAHTADWRSLLVVPMLRESVVLGTVGVAKARPGPFREREIELLKTLADQAVIAIENVRLFTELQARNQELTDALDRQTATADILQVISRSQTDVRPVFEAIADSAMRLFRAWSVAVCRFDGEQLHLEAARGGRPDSNEELRGFYPKSASSAGLLGACILRRAVYHVVDAQAADQDPRLGEIARMRGFRSSLNAPMLRDGEPVGAIGITRGEVRAFSETEIHLVRTFADQAVIAVENARLFSELQQRTGELGRSVDQLRALSEVGQAVSSTLDLDAVLQAIVTRASQLAGTRGCSIWEYDDRAEVFHLRATTIQDTEVADILRSAGLRKGEGAIGRAALTRAPVQIPDVSAAGAYEGPLRDALLRAGGGSVLTLPLLHEDRLLGGLTVSRRATGEFPPDAVALLAAFAAQSSIALQNARLFRELEAKSRELEVASRHKSQFLANMSHELRTPLNAILGYGEMMADGIYGELPATVRDVLGRVDASGRHLLGLINDVLDLSKIEAGQLTLGLADYSMEEIVGVVVASVEALAADKRLALGVDVAPDLPTGRGDQRRLMQVLLNLVGNAIKFTEEGGVGVRVRVSDAAFEISVQDTGPGIAPADQERIFEEFQQADTATTRPKGGTGLGLAISRRIVAMHGGRLWVESVPGEGATFHVTVPVRVEQQVTLAAGATP
jgi:GAF domain-containing protein